MLSVPHVVREAVLKARWQVSEGLVSFLSNHAPACGFNGIVIPGGLQTSLLEA